MSNAIDIGSIVWYWWHGNPYAAIITQVHEDSRAVGLHIFYPAAIGDMPVPACDRNGMELDLHSVRRGKLETCSHNVWTQQGSRGRCR